MMIYESKEGSLEKKDKKNVNYGSLTVSGTGFITIPCRGHPWEVEVSFSDPLPPGPCGPVIDDTVEIEIEQTLKPFPLWGIKISWEIKSGSVREIAWRATVIR